MLEVEGRAYEGIDTVVGVYRLVFVLYRISWDQHRMVLEQHSLLHRNGEGFLLSGEL